MKHLKKSRGLTLIEVLITITIIGILVGALVIVLRPVFVGKAYDTEAIAGLRGWYNAYTMYRSDNDDKEPRNFWTFLSYNPGAPWDLPKYKMNQGCINHGFYFARVHPVPIFEHRTEMLNPYDPLKEPVIEASYRCRMQEGRIEYFVFSPKYQRVIKQSIGNVLVPGVLQGGNVKWVQEYTPFEAEMNLLKRNEPRIP